ncbi:MAG: hypothetical protein WB677_08710 [Xanthobacteraceae bacterium]
MTRDQQMRKAMELLAPAKRERTKCRADISSALDIIAMMGKSDEVFADARSKTATRGRAAHHHVARRLLATHKAMLTSGHGIPAHRGADARLREIIELADIARLIEATKPPQKRRTYYDLSEQGIPDVLPDGATARFGAGKPTKAVEFANELLKRFGGDRIVSSKDRKTLAAILYGEPGAQLDRHLRAYQKRAGRK